MVKNRTFLPLVYSIIFIVLLNAIGGFLHFRLDLTSEKRHTLSEETKRVLTSLDDLIYIKVYLDGDFPAGFKRLQKQSSEVLQGFKNIAGKKIDFEFINPFKSSSEKDRNAVYKQLVELGLQPINLQVEEQAGMRSSIIFPGAIIYYKEKHIAVQLLKNKFGIMPELSREYQFVMLNNSIESLEYEFVSAISKLTKNRKEKIAFLSGHGELNEIEVVDISYSVLSDSYCLSEYYDIEHFDITTFELDSISNQPNLVRQLQKLQKYKAIIIAKPKLAFRKLDKLLIDQYIMGGGNVLWLLDGVTANMDSLIKKSHFMTEKKELNLDDMLLIYGVRINTDLIQDLRAGKIGVNKPKKYFPWLYYPLLFSDSEHPIVKGLDAIKCEFVSSIDTIKNGIKKSVLLHSSKNARVKPNPERVSLGILENPPKSSYFNQPNIPIAVLLEGNFQSVFKNRRILPKNNSFDFKESGDNAKMIVVSDGDVIRNNFSEERGIPTPKHLGYDRNKEGPFINEGNKTFIMNAMHYLCGNNQDLLLSPLKTKELKLRLLDKEKVQKYKFYIQLLNLLLPIVIIIIFGLLFTYTKKKKYA